MKKITYSLFLSASLFGFTDFGVHGKLYENKEPDIKKMIEKEVKEYEAKMNPDEIHEIIKKEVKKQSKGKTKLQFCKEDRQNKGPNYQTLEMDITNPVGRVYKKKGEKVLLRSEKPLDVCFIDATYLPEMKNQIAYFDKTVKELSGKEAECIYMVSGHSVLDIHKLYPNKEFYPTRATYEERFDVQCYPTLIHIEDDMKYDYEISIDYFKHSKGE